MNKKYEVSNCQKKIMQNLIFVLGVELIYLAYKRKNAPFV